MTIHARANDQLRQPTPMEALGMALVGLGQHQPWRESLLVERTGYTLTGADAAYGLIVAPAS